MSEPSETGPAATEPSPTEASATEPGQGHAGGSSSVDDFLEALASREPAPGGGAAAATAAAMAAALVAMCARSSSKLEDAASIIDEAERLRGRALELGEQDALAYAEVLAAAPTRDEDPERMKAALDGANRVPSAIVAVSDRATALAERVVVGGSPRLRGDGVTGLLLGQAAASSATELIGINTTQGGLSPQDLTIARAREAACRSRVDRIVRGTA